LIFSSKIITLFKNEFLKRNLIKKLNFAESNFLVMNFHYFFSFIVIFSMHVQALAICSNFNAPIIVADTNLVNRYVNLSWEKLYKNTDEALEYAEKGLELSKRLTYKKGIAQCLNSIGNINYTLGNYDISINYFSEALTIFREIEDLKNYAICLNNIGNAYTRQSNYIKALTFLRNAEKIFENLNDVNGMSLSYNNLGNLYFHQNNFAKAIEYYDKTLKIALETNDKSRLMHYLINIGNIEMSRNDHLKAIKHYQQALDVADELSDKVGQAMCYNNIGNAYRWLNKYSLAISNIEKSLHIGKEYGDKLNLTYNYINITELNNLQKEYEKAIVNGNKAIELAREIGYLDLEQSANLHLSNAYKGIEDYENALKFYEQYKILNDSIYNTEKHNQIARIEAQYQTEKQMREIELLNQKNNVQHLLLEQEMSKKRYYIILSFIIIGFIILFGVLIYSRYRHKQKIAFEKAMAEEQNLRFNAVIEAEEKERKRIAEDLHDSLGQMLSTIKLNMSSIEEDISFSDTEAESILKTAVSILDDSCNELRNISHNIMPSALIKFGLKHALDELIGKINKASVINIHVNIHGFEERIQETHEIALYRIIQEVLNNIIKHAEASNVFINLKKENNELSLQVVEDGKGFNISRLDKSEGLGWKNIKSRISMMSGRLNIISQIGKGSEINILIPLSH